MKYEPSAYKEPKGMLLGSFYESLSPDGWLQAHYESESDAQPRITPTELNEFISLVTNFNRAITTRDELEAYAKKHGKVIVKGALSTYGILIRADKLEYELRITGSVVEFLPYRRKAR